MKATVPKGMAVIGDMAFAGCNAVTVTLPEGIHTIGKRAFAGCTNLENLRIPRPVRMIGDEAFSGAIRLEVTLPAGARVGENALRGTLNEKKEQQAKLAEVTRRYGEAVAFYDQEEYAKALPLLLSFQKDDDATHLERVAFCYRNANRWTEAFSYYRRAASMGNPWAQYRLAQCYRWGNGCDKNLYTAFTPLQERRHAGPRMVADGAQRML